MALTDVKQQPVDSRQLTTSRGAALYIGAILGPGLLLLPGLAAAEAGPASILAWIALLGLSGLFAAVFSALGRHNPSAGGVIGYVAAGLGPRAGRAIGWMFLAGVVGGALAVTTALYLGLAIATISVLGPQAATDVPLAGLLSHAVGAAGPDLAAVAAVVLTLGATNAYINGAAAMAGQLVPAAPGRRSAPMHRLLAAIAAAGLLLILGYGLGIVGTGALVAVPTVLFLTVYLGAMIAAARVLRGRARPASLPPALAVSVMLGFCGWALAIPAAIALAVGWRARPRDRSAFSPASAHRAPSPASARCAPYPSRASSSARRIPPGFARRIPPDACSAG